MVLDDKWFATPMQKQFTNSLYNEKIAEMISDELIIPLKPENILAAYRHGISKEYFYKIDFEKIKQYCKGIE